MSPTIDLQVKFPVVDAELSALHARASGHPLTGVTPWGERLERHSLTWVGAFIDEQLIGFVHACWDGGAHAFLLDTAVDPNRQRKGIGARLVQALVDETTAAGCDWLHVDYEPPSPRSTPRHAGSARPPRAFADSPLGEPDLDQPMPTSAIRHRSSWGSVTGHGSFTGPQRSAAGSVTGQVMPSQTTSVGSRGGVAVSGCTGPR